MRDVGEDLFRVREECAHYTEHDTQDGKKYYFNAKLNQSVWDKPKCCLFFYLILKHKSFCVNYVEIILNLKNVNMQSQN